MPWWPLRGTRVAPWTGVPDKVYGGTRVIGRGGARLIISPLTRPEIPP